jgi:hypothetical protein
LCLDSTVPFNQRLQNYFYKGKKNGGKKKKDTASHQRFKKIPNALGRCKK